MQEFWRFVTGDWWIAVPMFAMSLTAVTLVVWRILLNSTANTSMEVFLPALQDRLSREGADGAVRFCREQPGVIPRKLFAAGLETSKQGLAAMRRAMANVIELEILPELNFLLPSVLAIAKIATMVGLFGTVISMIGTFTEIEELRRANKDIATQSGSIGLALFATALGLITAIPLVFAHVLFKAWISNFEIKMRRAARDLLLLVQAAKPGAAAPAAKAAPPAETSVTRR
jgi:biopolymer transport protein ExbB